MSTREAGNEGGESGEKDQIEVWQVADADDFRAMHDMIAICDGGECTVYECTDWKEQSAVASVLAAAGFQGTLPEVVSVQTSSGADDDLVKVRGFRITRGQRPEVELAIHQGLSGQIGGFAAVLMGQVGFHRSAYAFEYAWAAAGRPQVLVRQPALAGSGGGGADGPGGLFKSALSNVRLRTSLARFDELPKRKGEGEADG